MLIKLYDDSSNINIIIFHKTKREHIIGKESVVLHHSIETRRYKIHLMEMINDHKQYWSVCDHKPSNFSPKKEKEHYGK